MDSSFKPSSHRAIHPRGAKTRVVGLSFCSSLLGDEPQSAGSGVPKGPLGPLRLKASRFDPKVLVERCRKGPKVNKLMKNWLEKGGSL